MSKDRSLATKGMDGYTRDVLAHVGAGSNMLSFGRFQNAEGFAAALA